MRKMILTQEPIRGEIGLDMWECPKCSVISSTFSKEGLCECGEKVDFKTWQNFTLYEIMK